MSANPKKPRPQTLLFTCVGRRVELLQAFRAAAARRGIDLRIVGTDVTPTAPALSCVDRPIMTPRFDDDGYMPALLEIVERERPAALIPTIDLDLPILSRRRDDFDSRGCTAVICDAETVADCRDKRRTHALLTRLGIDGPETCSVEQALSRPDQPFPCFLKPHGGSASKSAMRIESRADLEYHGGRVENAMVQELVEGTEHTLDIYVGLSGQVRCVVPRRRWQVRGGEVNKGVAVKDPRIMEAGRAVGERLAADSVTLPGGSTKPRSLRGVLTVQCIVTREGRIRFIEINPRFGGGAPLSIAAGADLPGWLMDELLGETPEIAFDGFTHGMCMLRYDWSVFIPLGEDLAPRLGPPLRPPPAFM
jgi:carbamoyl-phosphate synthase large subunit